MEVIGKIKLINAEQQISATFKKRELIVTTEEQYPQHILIEFAQDKCDLLNNYSIEDSVKVSINLRGREWQNPQGETKYFNSIQGWRIEKIDAGANQSPPHQFATPASAPAPAYFPPASNLNEEEKDDLPF